MLNENKEFFFPGREKAWYIVVQPRKLSLFYYMVMMTKSTNIKLSKEKDK